MPGIAGVVGTGKQDQVQRMLGRISHRGRANCQIIETGGVTMGAVWPEAWPAAVVPEQSLVEDREGDGHFAEARIVNGRLVLKRDPLGVSPLYYGRGADGVLCFASEVRGLLEVIRDVREMPPGCTLDGDRIEPYFKLQRLPELTDSPEQIMRELKRRLEVAVRKSIRRDSAGAWLSGGLDSSIIAALARPHVNTLHTVAVGVAGAPDLECAREVANHLRTRHHEITVTLEQMLRSLRVVVQYVESFDAMLIRSSLMNYLGACWLAMYAPDAFSGEGADELFAGYEYLKGIDLAKLPDELIDITGRLHNTALQRVDRCAAASGLVTHVCFLDPDVVDYALRIPAQYKISDGVEKWVLREAMSWALPPRVAQRPKAKFWEGAGVGDMLAQHADATVSDSDFHNERQLPNGWTLNSKEELMYYRLFKEHCGAAADIAWVGRTKGAPVT